MDTESFSWVCHQCARRVPAKVDACRCGHVREKTHTPITIDAPDGESALDRSGGRGLIRFAIVVVVSSATIGTVWYAVASNHQPERTVVAPAHAVTTLSVPSAPRRNDAGDEHPSVELSLPSPIARSQTSQPVAVPGTAASSLEDLVALVSPAVVAIETSAGRGSGFFVKTDTIITNAHVVGSDVSVQIHRLSGETIFARVESVATDIDLAVLK